MKKASLTWETIVKLIIGLIVFGLLIILYFLLKERLVDLFYGVRDFLKYGGN